MTQPGNIGRIVPPRSVEASHAARYRDLQRQINELKTARTADATTIQGGTLEVADAAGVVVAAFGTFPGGQIGSGMWRPDGTPAFESAGGYTAIYDKASNPVVSDDATSGQGLATPWLSHNLPVNFDVATWPATAATSWTQIAACYIQRQNPVLLWAFYVGADSGTTGSIRLKISGTVIATSPTVTNSISAWSDQYAWPPGWTFNDTPSLTVEAMVSAGTGKVQAQPLLLTGRQS